jgi:hypothetical protein
MEPVPRETLCAQIEFPSRDTSNRIVSYYTGVNSPFDSETFKSIKLKEAVVSTGDKSSNAAEHRDR